MTDYNTRLDPSSSVSKYHYSTIKEMFSSEECNNNNSKYDELIDKISKYFDLNIIKICYLNRIEVLKVNSSFEFKSS